GQVCVNTGPDALRVKQANTVAGDGEIELQCWPIDHTARSLQRPASNRARELSDVQPVFRQREHAIAVLQSDRNGARRKAGIYDLHLALDIRVGTLAVGVDVELQLSCADNIRIEQLRQA